MNRQKKMVPKCLSNRQKVKEQAKELKRLCGACNLYEARVASWKKIALEEQHKCNEKDKEIQQQATECRKLKDKLARLQEAKQPFWKRVLG